jgi:hypothetical protein
MIQNDLDATLAVLAIAPASLVFAWWLAARRQVRRREPPPVRLVAASRVSHFEVGKQIDDIVSQIGLLAFVDSLLADESRSSFGPLLQVLDLDGRTREAAVRALTLLLPFVTQVDVDILRPPERSALYNILTLHYISGNCHDSALIIAVICNPDYFVVRKVIIVYRGIYSKNRETFLEVGSFRITRRYNYG